MTAPSRSTASTALEGIGAEPNEGGGVAACLVDSKDPSSVRTNDRAVGDAEDSGNGGAAGLDAIDAKCIPLGTAGPTGSLRSRQ